MQLVEGTVAVRAARDGDIDACRSIYALEVLEGTASFELEPPDVAELTRRWRVVQEAGLPWLVAEHGGEIAGYAYASAYRPRPAYRWTAEGSVYIARSARRRGVARQLLHALIDRATEVGIRQLVAVIGDSANMASIRLHELCGFRHVGTLENVGYKHGRWLDSVLMQRTLGKGASADPA